MKTENLLATVKVEPLNCTSQSYPDNNIYGGTAKKQRLESDEWMNHNQTNMNLESSNMNHNTISGFSSPDVNYEDYSPGNGKIDDGNMSVHMSDSLDGKKGSSKKGPVPRQQEELCLVCGDRASGYHYNALTCEGCKGFFRRSVTKNAVYCCKYAHECEMDMYMRRKCQECRLKKCLAVGMRPECVVPENQCAIKRKEKKAQKEKDVKTTPGSVGSNSSLLINQNNSSLKSLESSYRADLIDQLMKCDPPPHPLQELLPEKLLMENRAKGLPQLTANQIAVIYKLIWYQDGYEQPSEEDLKRITAELDGDYLQDRETHFRYITEVTILTVQLIVEFAKGLPAFCKIPQEDQITLLKACSSEVMMLRMARRYDSSSDSILFANNTSYTKQTYQLAGMEDSIDDLLQFCRSMYGLSIDNVEYALITAIVIFSDRPSLEKLETVEIIQSYYIEMLRVYIINRHGGDSSCSVQFAKLLGILTELRTMGNKNSEMCFSLKLKNKKLPRFLEEVWDVGEINNQPTATTNTENIVRERINRN